MKALLSLIVVGFGFAGGAVAQSSHDSKAPELASYRLGQSLRVVAKNRDARAVLSEWGCNVRAGDVDQNLRTELYLTLAR